MDPVPSNTEYNALRLRLKRELPAEAFEPQPLRGVIQLLLSPVTNLGLGALVVLDLLPWWGDLAVGVVLGQLWVSMGFCAHEALHRSVFRSRFWEDVMGWVGFAPWLVTPGLWRGWHVLAHHGATNTGRGDPDMLDSVADWQAGGLPRLVYWVTPGSKHPLSWFSFLFLFTLQGQLFLWMYSEMPEYAKIRMDRRRERVLSALLLLGWVTLAVALGPWSALTLILIPMAVSNATLIGYIATNHWLRPATPDGNNPFVNASSVRVPRFFDWLHLNFSWHQEHHVFPQMNPRFAPLLRAKMLELTPESVHVLGFGEAVKGLYGRPPLYADPLTFSNPDGSVTAPVLATSSPPRPAAQAS